MIKIDFFLNNGIVTFDDFNLDKEISLLEQLGELKEDMLQVEFSDYFILDVGWYPSFNILGEFQIRLIKECNWEHPYFFSTTKNIRCLEKEIFTAIERINSE